MMQSRIDLTDILRIIRERRSELSDLYTVNRIGIFGSYARGDQNDQSDVDILVDLENPTFDHYMDLKFHLEEILGRPIDLVLADTVKPRMKPVIDREIMYA